MPDFNIHNEALRDAYRLINTERVRIANLLNDNPNIDGFREAWADLGDALDKLSSADMEEFEAIDHHSDPCDVFAGRNVDAITWTTAKAGDYVVLRDLFEKAGTGPVYMLVTDPSFTRDEGNTMSVIATLIAAPTTQWPVGTCMLTFDCRGWQAWRDFGTLDAQGWAQS